MWLACNPNNIYRKTILTMAFPFSSTIQKIRTIKKASIVAQGVIALKENQQVFKKNFTIGG